VATVVTCLHRNPGARLRLCSFPFAGGGARGFVPWLRELPADVRSQVELWAAALPGRESRLTEPPFTDIAPLIDELEPAVASSLEPPYAFFGHSMGALVAYELAHRLAAPGPVHLVASAHRAPHLPDRHEPVHDLPDDAVLAKLRNLGGTPDEVLQNTDLRSMLLPVLRADITACETYVYVEREPLACSITAFGGNDDREVTRDELAAWEQHTREPFVIRMFPGGHLFVETARALVLRVLARDLRQLLLRLRARETASAPP
jgi:medium-chain acyl-[acyl-carrier-protein] hydrolase